MRLPSSSSNNNNSNNNNNYNNGVNPFYENLIHAIQETFKKYNVQLEMCLGDAFIMGGFLEFLKIELNASSLEFVVKVDEYANSHSASPLTYLHNNNNNNMYYGGSNGVNSPTMFVNSPSGLFPSIIQTSTSTLITANMASTSTTSSISSPGSKFRRKDSLNDQQHIPQLFGSGPKSSSRKAKAKEIIDRFLNDHSAFQVNLSSQIRDAVMRNYEKECSRGGGENDINPHLFDEARLEVSLQLKCDSFVRFVKSTHFINLITTKVEKEVSSKNLDSIYKFLNSYFSKIGEVKRSQISQFMTSSNRINSPSSPFGSGSGSGSSSSPLGLLTPREDFSSDEGSVDSVDSINHVNHVQTMLALHTLSPHLAETNSVVGNSQEITDKFTQTIGELIDENVTERQFELLMELIHNDTLWVKVHEDSESLCYVSENKFYHGNRGLKIYKEVGIIEDSSPEEVLYALCDMRILNIIDDTMSNVKLERYVKGPQYAVSYLSNRMKMAWPMSDRQFIIGTSIRDEPSLSGYTILRRSYDCKDVPLTKGSVRAIFLGGVVIERLSDKHTRFTSSGFVDMGGKFPLSLFNKILSMRQSKGVENVKKGITKRRNMPPEEQVLNSQNSMCLLDTLFYNREHKSPPNSSRTQTPTTI